jgi:hypothetical protein
MREELFQLSRRGFLGRLSQLALAVCGLQSWASGAAASSDEEVAVSKMSSTPHEFFTLADPDEITGDAATIAGRIREAFPYLKLDAEGLAAFSRDLVTYRDAGELRTAAFLGLRERFLLSTSFFDDGADEAKVVEYVAFHDPYITPCSNRLARIVTSSKPFR